MVGLTVCSPVLIAGVGHLAGRLPTGPRLALRDAARHRARSGPAVAAVMAVLCIPVALSAFTLSAEERARSQYEPRLRDDQVVLQPLEAQANPRPPEATLQGLSRVLPDAVVAPLALAVTTPITDDLARSGGFLAVSVTGGAAREGFEERMAVGGPDLLDALGGSEAADDLQAGRVVALGTGLTSDGTVRFDAGAGVETVPAVEVDVPAQGGWLTPRYVISPEAARAHLVDSWVEGWVLRSPSALTDAQRDAVYDIAAEDSELSVEVEPGFQSDSAAPRRAALAVCAVLALGVVAIATALAAAESRDDLTTLTAVGASPGTRRRLSGSRAGLLAGLGAVLAVPAGLLPAAVVLLSPRAGDYPFVLPWETLAGIALGVPLVAVAIATLASRTPRLVPARRLA